MLQRRILKFHNYLILGIFGLALWSAGLTFVVVHDYLESREIRLFKVKLPPIQSNLNNTDIRLRAIVRRAFREKYGN